MGKPRTVIIGDEVYRASVFLIHTKDEKGRPALLKYIADDHTINLSGGEEFMIGYLSAKMVNERRPNGDGNGR